MTLTVGSLITLIIVLFALGLLGVAGVLPVADVPAARSAGPLIKAVIVVVAVLVIVVLLLNMAGVGTGIRIATSHAFSILSSNCRLTRIRTANVSG